MNSPAPSRSEYSTYLAFFLDEGHPRARGIRALEPQPPSPQASRGRFYALVEIMGESPVLEDAVDQIQSVLAHTYYTAGGALSAVLEQAIFAAHEVLYALNQRTPHTDLRAGVLCAALVEEHLVMASAGPGLALLATGSRLDQFPPDPGHFSEPIGGEAPPQVSVFRHRAQDGDVLFMGESDWILLSDVRTLGGAIANTTRENRFEVVDYMRQQSGNAQVLGLLNVIQRAAAQPGRGPSQGDEQSPHQPWVGLPTALGATPPTYSVGSTAPPPVVPGSPSSSEPAPAPAPPQPAPAEPIPGAASRVPSLPRLPGGGRRLASLWPNLRQWFVRVGGNVLPDRRRRSQSPPAGPVQVDPGAAEQLPEAPPRPRRDLTPPERTRGSRARLFILLAVLVPLLAFAVVGGVYLRQGAVTQAEALKLVDMAEVQLVKARQALDNEDGAAARSALGEAQRTLNEATNLIGPTERIAALSTEIQSELQSLLRVRNLYALDVPLLDFPQDADPRRVLVFDQDVYVLDEGRQLVEHFRTDPKRSFVESSSGPVIRQGDVVEGVTVGRLVDMAWQPRIPGFADKASLLILDRNNNLFRYNRIDGATYLRLAAADSLQSVAQVEVYQGRLYLADEQRNQIFRYMPAGLGYDQPPDEWFAPQVQVNLAGLVSMAIDSDIWLLMEKGVLLRYRQGSQLPFSLDTSPGLAGRLVDMTMSAANDGRIYLADATQDRILVFDKQGAYIEQFQAAEKDALRGLRGLYLDETSGVLFILTQTSLYAHPLPE